MVDMSLYGLTGMPGDEEEDELTAFLKRVGMSSDAAGQRGPDAMPFSMGMAVQDMPKDQSRLESRVPDGRAPSTTGWRPSLEPSQRLEESSTPQKMSVPQTAPITQTQKMAQAAPASEAAPRATGGVSGGGGAFGGPISDGLSSFGEGMMYVGSAFAGRAGQSPQDRNITEQALIKAGADPQIAAAAVRNPDLMKVLLANLTGRTAPDIKTIKSKDKYGRETEMSVVYNPRTRNFERVDVDGSSAPASSTTAASPGSSGGGGAPAVPAPMPSMASGPAQAGPTPSATPKAATGSGSRLIPPGWRERRDIPLSSLPDPKGGYSYDAPNGYPLTDDNDNLKMVPTKELEVRSKSSAADDAAKLRDMVSGIDKTFTQASELINHPGLGDVTGRAFGGDMTIKGFGVTLPDITPNTSQADAFNKHQALLADVALRTMDRLKSQSAQGATGFGALSAKELDILQSSAGNLKLTSTYPELIENYKKFQSQLLKAREQMIDRFKEKYGDTPEGITPKQALIDQTTGAAIANRDQRYSRPREFMGFQIPFTSTTDPKPGTEPAPAASGEPWYNKPPFYIPQMDVRNMGGSAPAPAQARGIPNQAPAGARDLPPNSGYPPGSKAARNPNNPNEWIIWTPD